MEDWVGLTVGQVLELCGVAYDDVRMLDEPPGKLRGVEFEWREGGRPRRVVLEIRYRPDLFSSERSWEQEVVEAQKVVKVHASTDFLS